MKLNNWRAAPDYGCFVKMVRFDGEPMLQSAPMLLNGDREDSTCDVSRSAFDSEIELNVYTRYVSTIFQCRTKTVIDSIRG